MGESKSKNIEEVIDYWDKNPVHSVEFDLGNNLKKYCEYIDALRWSDNEKWARQKFYEFRSEKRNKILDAGCGIGVFSRFYARKGFEVHAIDISPKAIEITRKSFEIFGLKGEIKQGSVEEIPYPDNYFDYIVSNGVIHHTPNTEKAVNEFYRILKPGGTASICIYYKNILLQQPLWSLVRFILPILLRKKEGREKMLSAKTPEEFVRVYDGNDTPIAKVYTRRQADKLLNRFIIKTVEPHYFPIRFLRMFKVGGLIHKILDKNCGCLIYYLLQKPN